LALFELFLFPAGVGKKKDIEEAMQITAPDALSILEGHQFANLTTFRRDGTGVTTTVWFARDGDRVYIMTMVSAGKVKRLRNNPSARLGPSDRAGKPLGGEVVVRGRLLGDAERPAAVRALNRKYGWQKRIFDLMFKLRGRSASQVYLEFHLPDTPG
jgi:PPOX class probable F420-dependent enzyme